MGRRRPRNLRPLPEHLGVTALLGCGVLVAGCGAAARPVDPARHLCTTAQRAAAGPLRSNPELKVQNAAPQDIRCRLVGDGLVLSVEAQTNQQAWVEYDTEQTHFAQVFGPTNIHSRAGQPHYLPGVGSQAFWVPAQDELVATNAQPGRIGTYLTVTVTRHRRGGAEPRAAAAAVARAALAAAPRSG